MRFEELSSVLDTEMDWLRLDGDMLSYFPQKGMEVSK